MKSQTLRQSISSLFVTKSAYLSATKADPYQIEEAVNMSAYFDKSSIYAVKNLYDVLMPSDEYGDTPVSSEVKELAYRLGILPPPKELAEKLEAEVGAVIGMGKVLGNKVKSYSQEAVKVKNQLKLIDSQERGLMISYSRSFNDIERGNRKNRKELIRNLNFNMQNKQKQIEQKKKKIKSQSADRNFQISGLFSDIHEKVELLLEHKHFLNMETLNNLEAIKIKSKIQLQEYRRNYFQ